jgi:hypothetical protein
MKNIYLSASLGFSLGLSAVIPALAAPKPLLAGSSWALLKPAGSATLKTLSTKTGQVLIVTVVHASKPFYNIQLTHDIAPSIPKGATLRYQFWAMSPTKNVIFPDIEKRTSPYTHIFNRTVTLTPSWKEYVYTAKVPMAYGARGMAARLQVGQQAGVMEFKGISLTEVAP